MVFILNASIDLQLMNGIKTEVFCSNIAATSPHIKIGLNLWNILHVVGSCEINESTSL
jgi:hypothetical protein